MRDNSYNVHKPIITMTDKTMVERHHELMSAFFKGMCVGLAFGALLGLVVGEATMGLETIFQ